MAFKPFPQGSSKQFTQKFHNILKSLDSGGAAGSSTRRSSVENLKSQPDSMSSDTSSRADFLPHPISSLQHTGLFLRLGGKSRNYYSPFLLKGYFILPTLGLLRMMVNDFLSTMLSTLYT